MKKKSYFFLLILIFSGLTACNKNKRFEVDTNNNDGNFKIRRFDKDLVTLDTAKLRSGVIALYEKYPEFMPLYVSEVLMQQPNDTAAVTTLLRGFLADTVFKAVNRDVLRVFSDITATEKSISGAYTYIHHYFPDIVLPEIYFYVSGFNRPIIISDKMIAVGVDLYLGADYPRYEDFTYKYLTYTMQPASIAPDVVSALLFKSFPYNSKEERLVDQMLYRGKIMYLMSVLMPDQKPHDIMGYSNNQWEWSRKYEKEIWNTIMDQQDLFSTDNALIRKYMNDAPFTAPVSQDAPGRLGTWVGWQIVQSYMDNNKDVTLEALMKENNYQKILDMSGYQP